MPRRTSDNELIRTAQRGRILQAAADVFARKGFAAARISDVATRAGVSHGLVHHYFESKAALHRALLEQVIANADALPRAALERPGTPWERLEWFVRTALLGAQHAPEQFFLAVEAGMNEAVEPAVRELLATGGQRGVELLARLIAEGQKTGSVRAGNPVALSQHLFAMIQGLAAAQLGAAIEPDLVLGLLRPSRQEVP
jgi:AcrR family transcriptional regulator